MKRTSEHDRPPRPARGRAAPAPGGRRARFRIGDLSFRFSFEGFPGESFRSFLEYLSPFAAGGSGQDVEVRVRQVRAAPGRGGEGLARAIWEPFHRFPPDPRPEAGFRGEWKRLRSFLGVAGVREAVERAEAAGWRDAFLASSCHGPLFYFPAEGCADVFFAEGARGDPSPTLTGLFFQILSAALAGRDGLLVHGTGVVRGGAAYAFVGLSGAGKSTVGRLSEGALLADDGLILRKTEGGFRAFATPFCQQREGEAWKAGVREGSAPLGGAFFLEKARTHGLEAVPGPEAALKLLQHYIHYYRLLPDGLAERAFRTVEDLVKSCPVKTLRFRKDAGFWRVIPEKACLEAAGTGREREGRRGARRGNGIDR